MSSTSIKIDIEYFDTSISYKQASLGVLSAIASGYGFLFFTIYFLDPLLINIFNWSILGFASELYLIRITPPNYMYFIQVGFSFVTDIPTCVGWFFGGIVLGIHYKRKNTHFNGVKGSWKSFQIVIMAIELIFIGSVFYYLISSFIGSNMISFTSFFGGFLLFLLTFFISPGFWSSLSLVLLGGIIGSKFTKSLEGPPVPIEKVSKAKVPIEAKPAEIKSDVAESTVIKTAVAKPKPLIIIEEEIKQKRDEIKKIFREGLELLSEDREKAKAFFEDALDLAKEINDDELIEEIEDIIRKFE